MLALYIAPLYQKSVHDVKSVSWYIDKLTIHFQTAELQL